MTVSAQAIRVQYVGNGATTTFNFGFYITLATDLLVYVAGALTTLNVDYTMPGGSVGNTSGGTITFTVAPPAAAVVTLMRQTALSRTTSYQALGAFNAAVINADIDRLWLVDQEQNDLASRTITQSLFDTPATLALPLSTTRAGGVLSFDASGNVIVSQALGTLRGTWTTATLYNQRDFIIDGAAGANTKDVYFATSTHTSGTFATDLAAGKWTIVVDVAAINAQAAASSAASSATATTQAGIATTQAGIATSQATIATTQAGISTTQATNSATSATGAASSATTATTQAGTATTQATAASGSATAAAGSATTASTQATTATTQAGIATTQAGNSATSATASAGSATNSATSAATSTTQAAISTTQAGTATTQAGTATTQAGNSSTSAAAAAASATTASTQATNAATSATAAAGSATTAGTQATTATTQAGIATTQATNSAASAAASAVSAANAAISALGGISSLTGDIAATGPGAATATLPNINANVGTFTTHTVNAKGLITAAGNLALTGDISGTASAGSLATTLPTVNSNVGTFSHPTLTVNAKGQVTAASTNTLGTAASANTGTSGATVPLLNTAVTFSANTHALSDSTAGAGVGPTLTLTRDKGAANTAGDFTGNLDFYAKNSANASKNIARILSQFVTVTAGGENSSLYLQTVSGGSIVTPITIGPGVQIGNPTGGDKGGSTLNAGALYVNGVAVTPTPTTNTVRAWGMFNSSQTLMAGSAGVSISKTGVGNYIVTHGATMSSINYAVTLCLDTSPSSVGSLPGASTVGVFTKTTTGFSMAIWASSVLTDFGFSFAIHGV